MLPDFCKIIYLSQVANLTKNADAFKRALKTLKDLASSKRVKRSEQDVMDVRVLPDRKAQALENCAAVTAVASEMADLIQENPASPEALVKAARIEASHGLKCTENERAALSVKVAEFEGALETIKTALEDVEDKLLTLTGDLG